MSQLRVVLYLFLSFSVTTVILVVLVLISKVRRDHAERVSARFNATILAAWQAHDSKQMIRIGSITARGSVQQQSDYLTCCLVAASAPWWTSDRLTSLRQAAHESGLQRRIERQLASRRAVRRGLAVLMGGYPGTELPVEKISVLLSDPDSTVRVAAAAALERLGTQNAAFQLIQGLEEGRLPAPRLIERLGHSWAVPALVATLHDARETVACGLIRALGLAGDPASLPDLMIFAVRSESEEVRVQSMWAIARCSRHATESVRRDIEQFARTALDDLHAVIRSSALNILSEAGTIEDIPLISRCASDRDWFVRRAAARALTSFGEPGMDALRAIASSGDRYAAHRATEQLALVSMARKGSRTE